MSDYPHPIELLDPNRLNRVHVKTVRAKGNDYVVVLSDNSEVGWNTWIGLSAQERRNA